MRGQRLLFADKLDDEFKILESSRRQDSKNQEPVGYDIKRDGKIIFI